MLTRSDRQIGLQRVREFMKKQGLKLADLVEYGGEDLSDLKRGDMARRVDKCWSLMASLNLKHIDLEQSPD